MDNIATRVGRAYKRLMPEHRDYFDKRRCIGPYAQGEAPAFLDARDIRMEVRSKWGRSSPAMDYFRLVGYQ